MSGEVQFSLNFGREIGTVNLDKSGNINESVFGQNKVLLSIFRHYNENKDSVLDENERNALFTDLKNFAKDENLSENEAAKFLKNMGLDINKNEARETIKLFLDTMPNTDIPQKVELPSKPLYGFSYQDEVDSNGRILRQTNKEYARDGKTVLGIKSFEENVYDDKGHLIRTLKYDANSHIKSVIDDEYDENGNKTREIIRNSEGGVIYFVDTAYDESGRLKCEIERNADGSVDHFLDFIYTDDGKYYTIGKDADGKIISKSPIFDNYNK